VTTSGHKWSHKQTGDINKLVCWGWYPGGQRPFVFLPFH
jgi:hypothetical protein